MAGIRLFGRPRRALLPAGQPRGADPTAIDAVRRPRAVDGFFADKPETIGEAGHDYLPRTFRDLSPNFQP